MLSSIVNRPAWKRLTGPQIEGKLTLDMKVRDLVRKLEEDGWYLVRTRGSHRQFKHATKGGVVTVHGHPSEDVPPGTLSNICKQAQWR